MNKKMDENFIISRIQEILGDGFEVTESSSTGDVQVRSRGIVVFRIYQSIVRNGNPYIVKLDVEDHRETASKIAEELELELVG